MIIGIKNNVYNVIDYLETLLSTLGRDEALFFQYRRLFTC